MSTFDELNSPKALVCRREVNSDAGGATVHMVLLADGYLIDCGSSGFAEQRARIIADMLNEAGPDRLAFGRKYGGRDNDCARKSHE
jgi:hypothetical protein